MALNIKDPETERLAAEVAALTGQTKTGAVRYALRQVLQAKSPSAVAATGGTPHPVPRGGNLAADPAGPARRAGVQGRT